MPTYSPFLIVFIHLCRFRFPSGVIFFLLQGLPVFLVSLLILMPVSFCMSEKVFISPLCSVQFSHSVVSNSLQPVNHSMPGLPVHHQLLEFTQTHVHLVGDAIQPSVVPVSSCPQFFPASGSFQMSQLFASGGQSTGVSASTSDLPMNTQD